ncbi:TPA: hypothetical protein DCE37_17440 [Candidatus Latescibacteria bacterium]|nr:hypothetical protein [Candidatus Latescibacterota bacterium]
MMAILLIGSACVVAETTPRSSLQLLSEPIGGRGAALSGALSAVTDDQSAIHANPALVSLLASKDFVLAHHSTIAGIRQLQSGWAYGTGRVGIGLSLGINTAGGFETRTGPTSSPIGTFNLFELNAAMNYGQRITPSLSGGLTARFLHEDLEADRASGFGLDAGLAYTPTNSQVTFGGSILNLGKMEALDQVASPLPREIRIGAALNHDRFLLSSDVRFPRFGSTGVLVGGEFTPFPVLTVRAGYQTGHDTRSVSYGVGLKRKNWRIDYAFVPSDLGLEDSHRVSIGIR